MAKKANPALAILGVAGVGLFAWLNWSRIKSVTHKILEDSGVTVPDNTVIDLLPFGIQPIPGGPHVTSGDFGKPPVVWLPPNTPQFPDLVAPPIFIPPAPRG